MTQPTITESLNAAKALETELKKIPEILQNISRYGPPQGEKHEGTACAVCDMGGAGYSSRGDGFHDDDCAVKDAQAWIAANQAIPLCDTLSRLIRVVEVMEKCCQELQTERYRTNKGCGVVVDSSVTMLTREALDQARAILGDKG